MEINVLHPSSIIKKQSADLKSNWNDLSPHEKSVQRNRKRGFRIATNARVNKSLYGTVCAYMDQNDLTEDELMYFCRLRRSLQTCTQHSLFRQYKNGGALEYIASQTCKHKLCKVCNTEREKSIRRKYLSYFRKNKFTETKVDKKTGEVLFHKDYTKDDFDFIHLTLTVPHTENGFQGKEWYATELMNLYNKMRKCDWWKYFVWGGEFGIEVTKNESGLHIHIHSLLIVHKEQQNRNNLHREILLKWNELTVDLNSKRTFTDSDKEAIKKGNKTITDIDVNSLDPKGATFIGLESLYVLKDKKISASDKWIADKGKWKHYVNSTEENELMAGVLECLKYHFEPVAFDKDNGVYNFELLRQILPNVFRKPLYRKFGNLHGLKELNLNESDSLIEETKEAVEELGKEAVNPDSGNPDSEHIYIVVSARNVFYDLQKNLRPHIPERARKRVLENEHHTLMSAINHMIQMDISAKRSN